MNIHIEQATSGQNDPVVRMVQRIWLASCTQVGEARFSRIVYVIQTKLWGGGKIPNDVPIEALWWFLFRWLGVAFAMDPAASTNQLSSLPNSATAAE